MEPISARLDHVCVFIFPGPHDLFWGNLLLVHIEVDDYEAIGETGEYAIRFAWDADVRVRLVVSFEAPSFAAIRFFRVVQWYGV